MASSSKISRYSACSYSLAVLALGCLLSPLLSHGDLPLWKGDSESVGTWDSCFETDNLRR